MNESRVTRIVLDANIWDKLSSDDEARERVRALCEDEQTLEIIVPATLARELEASPFGGVPDWFPTNQITDSVFVLDHTPLGEGRLGDGDTFAEHRGSSGEIADAVIADAVATDADVLVTEDKRARKRYREIKGKAHALDWAAFRGRVLGL